MEFILFIHEPVICHEQSAELGRLKALIKTLGKHWRGNHEALGTVFL
jgi:hypothetical protein